MKRSMTRELRTGDIATITINDHNSLVQTQDCVVMDISQSRILIDNDGDTSVLIPTSDRHVWQIYNYYIPHSISFRASQIDDDINLSIESMKNVTHSGFTGVIDTDLLILLELPYQGVLNMCAASKEHSTLCDNNYFWEMKLERDFPGSRYYVPDTSNFKLMYKRFATENIEKAAKRGHLNIVQYLYQRDPLTLPTKGAIDRALRRGHLEIVRWANELCILPSEDTIHGIARRNNTKILAWLASLPNPIHAESIWIIEAFVRRQLNTIKYLYETDRNTYGLLNEGHLLTVAEEGNLDIVKWLAPLQSWGYGYKWTIPYSKSLDYWKYGQIERILADLDNPILPSKYSAENLLREDQRSTDPWYRYLLSVVMRATKYQVPSETINKLAEENKR